MPHSNVTTLFNFLLLSIGMFVLALAVAARKKWISMREFSYVAPVLTVTAALTVGNFLYKVSPHTPSALVQVVGMSLVWALTIGIALFAIWKRTKSDEEELLKNPPKPKKSVTAGPQVSASELRKRKKKR